MKSKLLFVTTLLLVALIAISACKKKDETPDNGSGGGNDNTNVSESYIYKEGTSLGLRCDFELYKSNELETLSGNLYSIAQLKHFGGRRIVRGAKRVDSHILHDRQLPAHRRAVERHTEKT